MHNVMLSDMIISCTDLTVTWKLPPREQLAIKSLSHLHIQQSSFKNLLCVAD